jgi:hypothetical protein
MRARFLLLVLLLLPGGAALADAMALPGHALSDKDAEAKASVVFIGQLVDLQPVKVREGRGEYVGKVIYAARPSNGIRTPYVTSQNTTVRIPAIPSDLGIAMTLHVGAHEAAPQVGKSYVFYAKDNTRPGSTGYEAVKVAPTSAYGEGVRTF